MWGRLYLFISVMCLAKNAVLGTPRSCFFDNRNAYPFTGIETPYSSVHNKFDGIMTLNYCKPMQIWMLNRHGTEYPRTTTMNRIKNFTCELRPRFQAVVRLIYEQVTNECTPVYARIRKNWKTCSDFDNGKAKYLTEQGKNDMVSLGERIRAQLPGLFEGNMIETDKKTFMLRSTATQSTTASMLSFVKGAFTTELRFIPNNKSLSEYESMNINYDIAIRSFGRTLNNERNVLLKFKIVPVVNDTLLKLHDSCKSWDEIISQEMTKFRYGPVMANILTNVFQRLKMPETYSLQIIFLLYEVCRYERAVCPSKPSPWCDAFNEDEMRAFEYQDDLLYYHDFGPGKSINSQLGCHPIQDMLQHFTKLENGTDEPKGVFHFADSIMLSLFLTAMGIGKDSVQLTAENFQYMKHNWAISRLVPSAANFAAIFYRCINSSDDPFKVAFYLNENPLTLEGCQNGVCNWAQLKQKLGVIADNCNTEVCGKTSTSRNFKVFDDVTGRPTDTSKLSKV